MLVQHTGRCHQFSSFVSTSACASSYVNTSETTIFCRRFHNETSVKKNENVNNPRLGVQGGKNIAHNIFVTKPKDLRTLFLKSL